MHAPCNGGSRMILHDVMDSHCAAIRGKSLRIDARGRSTSRLDPRGDSNSAGTVTVFISAARRIRMIMPLARRSRVFAGWQGVRDGGGEGQKKDPGESGGAGPQRRRRRRRRRLRSLHRHRLLLLPPLSWRICINSRDSISMLIDLSASEKYLR